MTELNISNIATASETFIKPVQPVLTHQVFMNRKFPQPVLMNRKLLQPVISKSQPVITKSQPGITNYKMFHDYIYRN
jgi:hypothetical protein